MVAYKLTLKGVMDCGGREPHRPRISVIPAVELVTKSEPEMIAGNPPQADFPKLGCYLRSDGQFLVKEGTRRRARPIEHQESITKCHSLT